jgi:hypothetical protein
LVIFEKDVNSRMRQLINFGLFLFFASSLVIFFGYATALYEKIIRPNFKNLNSKEFLILGIIVFALATADFFIIRKFIREIRQK